MTPAPFNQAVTPISPVYICLSFFKPNSTPSFPLVTIVFQSSPIHKKTSNHLRLLVWTCPLTLSSLSFLLCLLRRKYLLIQRRLTRRLLHLYKLLTILQLVPDVNCPPQLDYSFQFRRLKLINLKLQKNFLNFTGFCLTFDPFYQGLITSKFNLIVLFLDVNIAASTTLITPAEPNDPGLINTYNTVSNQSSVNGK